MAALSPSPNSTPSSDAPLPSSPLPPLPSTPPSPLVPEPNVDPPNSSTPLSPPPPNASSPSTPMTPTTTPTPSATPPSSPPASPPPPTEPPGLPPPAVVPPPSIPANPPTPPPPTAVSPPPPTTPPLTPPPQSSPPTSSPPSPSTTPPPINYSPPPSVIQPTSPPPSSPISPLPSPPVDSPPPPSTPPGPSLSPPGTAPPHSSPSVAPPTSPPPSPPLPSRPVDSPPLPSPPRNAPPPSSPSVTPSTSPPLPNPPVDSPPSPVEPSPSPPRSAPQPAPPSQPPRSPSQPAASPSRGNPPPPTRDSPPPSHGELSPPSTPGPPAPASPFYPPPLSQTIVPPASNVPANRSSPDATGTANNAPSNGGLGTPGDIAIGVIAGLLILGIIGLIGVWFFKRKKSSGSYDGHVIPTSISSSPRSDGKLLMRTEYPGSTLEGGSGTGTPTDHGGYGHSRSWFTYKELYDATSGFSDEKLLGEGGFGCVHKGILKDGRVVAVKQLKIGGGQGEREFKAEVEIISRIHHRHLVSLIGYSIWDSKRLLVYEYVPNNTLHFHLYGDGIPVLDWATRVKIVVGAARGITYLHEDCHPRIIHRDIKSSNILLDNNFEARVADFGLAKLAMDAETHVSTRVMGTFGYLAPEYATTGKLTEKSDVYSFGVVLLELITGRKPVDESQPVGDESLVEWARPLLSHAIDTGDFEGLVDPRLGKNYIESEMLRMIEAAAACVRHSAVRRPRMGLVLRALSMSDSGDLSNGLRVGESQLYDSSQQSAEIRWFQRMAFGSQDISTDHSSNPGQEHGLSGPSRQDVVDISTRHELNQNSSSVSSQNQSGERRNPSEVRQSTQHNRGSEMEDIGNQ